MTISTKTDTFQKTIGDCNQLHVGLGDQALSMIVVRLYSADNNAGLPMLVRSVSQNVASM